MMKDIYEIKTVDELIDAFGGPSKMGPRFDVGPSAVCNWRAAQRFPDRLHMKIYTDLLRRGINVAPELVGMADIAA